MTNLERLQSMLEFFEHRLELTSNKFERGSLSRRIKTVRYLMEQHRYLADQPKQLEFKF